MNFGEGVFEVIATSGDTELGGTDMDKTLVDHIADEFKREQGIDLRGDSMAMTRVKEAAEKAKIELSGTMETEINLPFVTADAAGPKHLVMRLTRAKLEELVHPIVDRCRAPLESVLRDAKIAPTNVERIILVGGPTRMPIVQKLVEDYIGKKIERGIDPMECVAKGAAVQGAVLGGEVKDVLLLDVTPLTLGIETLGGVATPLITRNTTIPSSKSQIFSTAADSQTSVEVHVLQGERQMAKDNRTLGRFILDGIPPAPRGMPQVEVIFDIDANGILTVTAKDKASGKTQNVTIRDSGALSKEDIEKMREDAQKFAEEDRKNKEAVETRNQADQVIYATEKMLREYGDKVSAEVKQPVEEKLEAVKKAKEANDTTALKKAMDELSEVVQKVGAEMYKNAAASEKPAEGEAAKDGKKVVEAEYEEKKGDEKP